MTSSNDEARRWHTLAGEAADRARPGENAENHYRAALEITDGHDLRWAPLEVSLGHLLRTTGRRAEAVQVFADAAAASAAAGTRSRAAP